VQSAIKLVKPVNGASYIDTPDLISYEYNALTVGAKIVVLAHGSRTIILKST
jgi:hypothetical protein